MKEKDDGVKIQLLEETTETFIGEILSMAVLTSGCTKTVCGETSLNCYLESLSDIKNFYMLKTATVSSNLQTVN